MLYSMYFAKFSYIYNTVLKSELEIAKNIQKGCPEGQPLKVDLFDL